MSNIDFLSESQKKEETEKEAAKSQPDIQWTNPQPLSNSANKNEKEENREIVKDSEISAWLKKLKAKSTDDIKGAKELKRSKEAVAEYQQIFNKGKNKGSSSKELIKAEEKNQSHGIIEIIKNKLAIFQEKKQERNDTIKTNLIRSEGVIFFDWKKKIKILAKNFAWVFLIFVAVYGFLIYEEREIGKDSEKLATEVATIKGQITDLSEGIQEVDRFQEKIKLAKYLLDKHVYWTNLFSFLEENILKTVSFNKDFQGNINGLFEIYSIGESFGDLTYQSRVLRKNNDKILNVSISSGKAIAGDKEKNSAVEFRMTLKMNPEIFYK